MTMPAAVGLAVGGAGSAAPAVGIDPHEAKVKQLRGEDYPTATATEPAKVQFLRKLTEVTEPESSARHRQATRNMLYAHGRQYITFSKRTKTYEDLPLDPLEVRVTMNYIRPVLRSKTQRMLSGPVQFEAKPDSNAMDARDRAKLGASLIQSRFEHTHMEAKLDQALELAMTGGVGVFKGFWNPDIGRLTPATMQFPAFEPAVDQDGQPQMGPDGQPLQRQKVNPDGTPVFEMGFVDADKQRVETRDQAFHYRPGDTDTAVRTIFNIRITPEATAWDPGSGLRWLLESDVIAVEQAREMFTDFAPRINAMDEADAMALTLERIAAGAATAGTYSSTIGNTNAPQKKTAGVLGTTLIQEYWELPSSCYPRGRLLVRVGEVIVFDGEFPQGIFPYTPIFDEPAPMTPMGRPSVNDAISPQDLINRQWGSIDQEMRLAGYARYAAFDIPGVPEQITPEERTVIRVPLNTKTMNKRLSDLFHRIEPGAVGGDRWKIIDAALRALFDIFGFHEVSRGQVPPGVDSGVAIEHLLEEDRGQLAKAVRALEASLLDWGKKQLQIAVVEYGKTNVERWLPIDRPDLGYMLESVDGTNLPDPESITIQLEGFKPQSDTAYRAEIKWGLENQLLDPRQALKALDLGRGMNAVFDSESRHYARARRINIAIERGEYQVMPPAVPEEGALPGEPESLPQVVGADGMPFVLPEDDNHEIHFLVLDELILDDTKPPQVRAVAQLVKAERRQIVQEAALAAPPAPPA